MTRGNAWMQLKAHSTQHTGHSTQRTALADSTQRTALQHTALSIQHVTHVDTSIPPSLALMDLKNKDKLREKFGIKDEHVLPFDVQPIIHTPGLGNTPAKDLCIEQKVASQNDREKLEAIKVSGRVHV